MTASAPQIRRATLDDLPRLRQLWATASCAEPDLDRRITEFQIAEAGSGTLVGCIALQIADGQGKIHTEIYSTADVQQHLQPAFWDRLQSLARNHGLHRLWLEHPRSFWQQQGFLPGAPEDLERFPEPFGASTGTWGTLKLRNETVAASIEREFELFKQSHQTETARTLERARLLRWLAIVTAVVTFGLVGWAIWNSIRRLPIP